MTGNIVGEEFKKYVFDQISQRQSNQFSGYSELRSGEQVQYLNNQNSWIKLASSVDIEDGEGATRLIKILQKEQSGGLKNWEQFKGALFSKKAILFNGLSSLDSNGKYQFRSGVSQTNSLWDTINAYGLGGTNQGLQPMPGITSVSIQCLNRGSIRNAIIEIKAYNKTQFAIIELLYLRLGFSMMLEWGNNKYINNQGNYVTDNEIPTLVETNWFNPKVTSQLDVLRNIEDLREEWNGNYDGFFGKVVNFNWSFESDGSYNITLKLVTLGDVIESIQVNTPPSQATAYSIKKKISSDKFKGYEDGSPIISAAQNNVLGAHLFSKIGKENTWNYPKTNGIDYLDLADSRFFKENLNQQGTSLPSEENIEPFKYAHQYDFKYEGTKISNQYRYYITFSELLQLVDRLIIPKLILKNQTSPQIEIDFNETTLISYHPNQISFDPRICIFKYNLNGQGIPGVKYKSIGFVNLLKEYIYSYNGVIAGQLSNLYLNLDFISKCLNSNISESKISLFQFFQSICNGLNDALGGINKIEPIIKDDNIITFIDQVSVPGSETLSDDGEIPKTDIVNLELFGYNPSTQKSNFVKDFNFQTEITPELASMVSIGATAGGSSVENVEGTMFEKWNAGLKDRYSDGLILNNKDDQTKTEEEKQKLEKQADDFFEKNIDTKWRIKIKEILEGESGRIAYIKHPTFNIYIERPARANWEYPNSFGQISTKEAMKREFRIKYVNAHSESNKPTLNEIISDVNKNYAIYLSRAFAGDASYEYIDDNGITQVTELPTARDAQYLKYNSSFISQGKGVYQKYITAVNNKLYKDRIIKQKIKEENGEKFDVSPSNTIGFIPVNLGINLQGISGIKIYNKLNISQDFLPYQYPEALKFIIKQVNHELVNNQWTTTLETISIPNITKEANIEYITNKTTGENNFSDDAFLLPSGSRGPIIPEDENAQFKIIDNYTVDGQIFPTTVDKVLQDINITFRSNFSGFLKTIESKYKGYTIQINSIGRTIEEQKDLAKRNKLATTRISTHNFNSAVDINVFLPTGEELGGRNSRASWINTGIPDIAKDNNLGWGGDFDGDEYDPIHFYHDFDRDEAYTFQLSNPDFSSVDVPLSPLA